MNIIGVTGIILLVSHILGLITGWAWPILYGLLIIIANEIG